MGKNPMTCKNSINFDSAYICRLELLPCARVKKCALETMDDMVKAASECINAPRDRRKAPQAQEHREAIDDDWEEIVEEIN